MRKLMPFLACLLLVLTALSGTAQATGVACCDETSLMTQMCDCCDADQGPKGADKGCAQCAATCHAHHAATPFVNDLAPPAIAPDLVFGVRHSLALAGQAPDRMLRPPRT